MKTLVFSIIAILLSFMTSCDGDHKCYLSSDKGVVVTVKKVNEGNKVIIKLIKDPEEYSFYTYVIFLTRKQYNINDTIYFTNLK